MVENELQYPFIFDKFTSTVLITSPSWRRSATSDITIFKENRIFFQTMYCHGLNWGKYNLLIIPDNNDFV